MLAPWSRWRKSNIRYDHWLSSPVGVLPRKQDSLYDASFSEFSPKPRRNDRCFVSGRQNKFVPRDPKRPETFSFDRLPWKKKSFLCVFIFLLNCLILSFQSFLQYIWLEGSDQVAQRLSLNEVDGIVQSCCHKSFNILWARCLLGWRLDWAFWC